MERLTDKITNIETGKVLAYRLKREVDSLKGIQKLGAYEDAEEQGLLLRLPCKNGDRVYSVTRDFISEYTICGIEVYTEGLFFCWRCEKGIYINVRGFTNYQIGVDVFLTKEEAEQALKQMGE